MGFTVDTAALEGLPRLLDRLGEDADAGRSYLLQHARLSSGEGLFNEIVGSHQAVVDRVEHFFAQAAGPVAVRQSASIRAAVVYYRRTDLQASSSLDAAMPAVAGVPWLHADTSITAGGQADGAFADRVEPQQALVPPTEGLGTPGFPLTVGHLISLATAGRGLILTATGVAARLGLCDGPIDIFLECARPLTGDWDGLHRCGDVMQRLGAAATMMGANVTSAAVDTQSVWTGNAADGCRNVLHSIGLALDSAMDPLSRLADQYHEIAQHTLEIAEEIAELLSVAVDLVALAAIEIYAAEALTPTAIGPVALGVAATGTLIEIVSYIHRAVAAIETAAALVRLFRAALNAFVQLNTNHPLPELPVAYTALPAPPTQRFN